MAKHPTILGVDDRPRNLDILRKTLERDYTVITAASGEEALQIAPRLRPDLVLLDIMMPGIDGYETCRRLRAQPELSAIKIIMVSAKAMTSERLEGYAAGADDYVVKPFDQDELLAKVRVYARLKSVEEVDRLKSDLLDLLSHETGTPLTGIMGALNLLRDTTPLAAEQQELVSIAESSSMRLQSLVKRICLITELKSGCMPVIREPADLRALAESAIEDCSEVAERSRVKVILQPGDAMPILGDAELISWVTHALLDNAIRVSPHEAVVTLRLDWRESRATLTVSDGGPGIEPELLPRVFEPFVVADIKHHKKGSGLSLAAARLIAEHHAGTLTVESEIGRGAVFQLTLPSEAAARVAA